MLFKNTQKVFEDTPSWKGRFKELALLNGKTSCSGQFSKEGSDALRYQASAAYFNFAGLEGIKHAAGREISCDVSCLASFDLSIYSRY